MKSIVFSFVVILLLLPFNVIFSNSIFAQSRPTIPQSDILDFKKVVTFVEWFLKNEKFVDVIRSRSSNIIYNEGFRPSVPVGVSPETASQKVKNLEEWFIRKIYGDLNLLKGKSKQHWKDFINKLDAAGKETLITAGEIGVKYSLTFENFVYEKEISKIPVGLEREHFKANFLSDNVIGAEIRILAWLYHEYFGEWYKIQ